MKNNENSDNNKAFLTSLIYGVVLISAIPLLLTFTNHFISQDQVIPALLEVFPLLLGVLIFAIILVRGPKCAPVGRKDDVS